MVSIDIKYAWKSKKDCLSPYIYMEFENQLIKPCSDKDACGKIMLFPSIKSI